ncbi:response regulator transcription factor [Chloroflexota bacterium]
MRILLADDQSKVRFALRVLLERQPGVVVQGEAADAQDLLVQTGEICPDVVLLAWELPGFVPSELLAALHTACSSLQVIALSGRPEARHTALAAGVDAFVSKTDPPEKLLSAIQIASRDNA